MDDAWFASCEEAGELTVEDRQVLRGILGTLAFKRAVRLALMEINGTAMQLANIDLQAEAVRGTRMQGKIAGMNRFIELLHQEAHKHEETAQ